jgi:hypothetical protein
VKTNDRPGEKIQPTKKNHTQEITKKGDSNNNADNNGSEREKEKDEGSSIYMVDI